MSEIEISRGFWMFETPCTQGLWLAVMGENPSHHKDRENAEWRPVEQVSWRDCQEFFRRLNDLIGGSPWRLPTEAEWEYACRAGTTGPRYDDDVDAIAWHRDNSGGQTREVALKRPNAWGLYDTLGNVMEWCEDLWGTAEHPEEGERVVRGGSFLFDSRDSRAAFRTSGSPDMRWMAVGFRCCGDWRRRSSRVRPR